MKKMLLTLMVVGLLSLLAGCQTDLNETGVTDLTGLSADQSMVDKGEYYLFGGVIKYYKNNSEDLASINRLLTPEVNADSRNIASATEYAGNENTQTSSTRAATTPFYRLFNSKSGDHFYTTSASEVSYAVSRAGYTFEGIQCRVGGPTPFYRLFNPTSGDHFYTVNQSEVISAMAYSGYKYEGVACYVNEGSNSLYRLFNSKNGDHFYTTSAAERNYAVSIGYKYEGIACNVN